MIDPGVLDISSSNQASISYQLNVFVRSAGAGLLELVPYLGDAPALPLTAVPAMDRAAKLRT
eukprot:161137-Prymnesium_polylepis.1